jgi:hypothetical protein
MRSAADCGWAVAGAVQASSIKLLVELRNCVLANFMQIGWKVNAL